tara:strand:- start:15936 stop:16823 length:888 start_codon:yes stop_codon:yes gene_type:complete
MNSWRNHITRLEGAYAQKTIDSYSNDFARFAGWCRKKRFKCLPATPETVARYIDEIAVDLKVSTVKRRLCAIRKLHHLAGHRGITDDETVLLAVRRAKRSKPGRPRQALGVTAERRDRMLAVCRDDPRGLRDRLLLAVGFDTLCRRSELVAIRVQDLTRNGNGTYSVLVRRAKNDQEGLGRTAHLSSNASRLIDFWLEQTGLTNGPLLRPVYRSSPGNRSLCAASVGRILKDLARQADFDEEEANRVTGHSLRVGAAQSLTKRGVGILPIMSAGGWKSMAVVARYVENVEMNLWD